MIKSIIPAILLLGIMPVFIGKFMVSRREHVLTGAGVQYVFGLLGMYGLFTVLCVPAVILQLPFHVLCQVCFGIMLGLTVVSFVMMIKNRELPGIKREIKLMVQSILDHKLFLLLIVLVAYQALRLVAGQMWQYRDDKTYIALVNDILSTDVLYGVDDATGSLLQSGSLAVKYVLASWYPFEAFISYITGFHPLIICKTVLPPILLLVEYDVLWILGSMLYRGRKEKTDKKIVFMLACVLLYEAARMLNDQAMIAVFWPGWGKNIVAMICVPLFLVLFVSMMERQSDFLRYQLLLLLITLVGCGASNMGIMMMPVEAGILTLIWWIRTRKFGNLLRGAMAFMPVALLYAALYVLLVKNMITVGVRF